MASRKRAYATGSGWTRVGKRKVWGTGTQRIPVKGRAGRFRTGYDRTGGFYGRFAGRGAELKFFDTTVADATQDTAGSISMLSANLIVQGIKENDRIGRKCRIRSIMFRGQQIMPTQTSASATGVKTRIIVYLDKQCNGATAAVLSILETASVNSFRNLAESGRFQIFHDRTYNMTQIAAGGQSASNVYPEYLKPWSFFKQCDIPLEFGGVTGAITEVRSNNIGVLAISSDATVTLGYICRVRFSDQ